MDLKKVSLFILMNFICLFPAYGEEEQDNETQVTSLFEESEKDNEPGLTSLFEEDREENNPQPDPPHKLEKKNNEVQQASPPKKKNQDAETQPVLYYADGHTYDRDLGVLILKGHVEFSYQGNVLEADYVTYNENTDIVTASGNVRLRQADGDINFAEYVELTGDMKEGIVLQMRTLLEDDSKIASIEGRKFEDRDELDQAVYTPCELCGDKPPTWQINARRAVKDKVNKDISFTDAEMRILDVPVLYVPYATQPLERRSGFLIPRPDISSDLGGILEIPYFFAISEDKDLTLTPIFFTKQNPMLFGEYRQAFENGFLNTEGSIIKYKTTEKDKKAEKKDNFKLPDIRGYIFGKGRFDLNEVWRLKGEGGVVSDKTYFKKFQVSGWKNEPNLTSKGFLEGFLNQRDYTAAKVYYFQGLQNEDRQKKISAPLPMLEYSGYSGVDPLGGRFTFDGNLLNLVRHSGVNMQRGIGIVGWQRPWVTSSGQVFTPFASTRGDLYKLEQFRRLRDNGTRSGKKEGGGRFFPQTGIEWKWPFMNTLNTQSYVIQPITQLIAAPDQAIGIKARDIPDEDSTDFEFNDANLFSPDRFPGYDKIDTGTRAIYGGELYATGDLFGDVNLFLGQSYSLSKPPRGEKSQGLNKRPSDYVGRVQINPYNWLQLNYRFRYAEKTWQPRVSEVGGSVGPEIAKFAGNYVFVSKNAGTSDKKDFNQITLNFSSKFTKHWTLLGLIRKDLNKKENGGKVLEKGAGLVYRDDCFGLGLTVKRLGYRDRDVKPSTVIMTTLFLKNIGEFQQSLNLDQGLLGSNSPSDD